MPENNSKISSDLSDVAQVAINVAIAYEAISGKKLGLTGEVGEVLVAANQGLTLAISTTESGHDAVDADGKRVQIKARRSEKYELPRDTSRTGEFSIHKYDYALLALLNRAYRIHEIWRAEYDAIEEKLEGNGRRDLSIRQFKSIGRKIFSASTSAEEKHVDRLTDDQAAHLDDLVGNNAAFTCRHCGKVFIVSGMINREGRECPKCGKSKGYIDVHGENAKIEW